MIIQNYQLLGIHAEKDKDSVITSCSEAFLHYAGVKSDNKIVGYTDYDFSWGKYADIYRRHELDALSGNHYSTIIPLNDFKGNEMLFLHTKMQRLDDKGNVIGILGHAIEIINPTIQNIIYYLNKRTFEKNPCFYLNKYNNRVKLSKREIEVLFYLSRGKNAKAIARIIGISHRTVESYIDNIKIKVGCFNKSGLIDFAIENGFMNFLPKDLHKSIKAIEN